MKMKIRFGMKNFFLDWESDPKICGPQSPGKKIKFDKAKKVGYSVVMGTYPPRTPESCVLGIGDSFESLALRHSGDVRYAEAIAQANGLSLDSQIMPGQTLMLPQMVPCLNTFRMQAPYYLFANALMNQFSLHHTIHQPAPHHTFWKTLVHAIERAFAIAIAAALSLAVEVSNFSGFDGSSAEAVAFLEKKLDYLVSRY